MASRAPHRVGADCTPLLSDYENEQQHNTGDGKVVVHSNRVCVYKEKAGRKETSVVERLWANTEAVKHPELDTPCYLFKGIEYVHKYQQVWYHGKYARIHRLAMILDGIDLTPGMVIDHLCERKNCWNTAHLEEVTPGDNTRRYHAKKGR